MKQHIVNIAFDITYPLLRNPIKKTELTLFLRVFTAIEMPKVTFPDLNPFREIKSLKIQYFGSWLP